VESAVRLARRYYELVSEEGDPRYLGYAQAVLAPWWEMAQPPLDIQMLRASLRQFQHDFSGALIDLSAVLKRNPHHAPARTLRAIISIVQAHYLEARTDCQALRGIASHLMAVGCSAMIDGLTGRVAFAYQSLNEALQDDLEAVPDEKRWANLRLAEMAQRLGWDAIAETHFKQALALGTTDTLLLAAYTDFLLEKKRPKEVVSLLKDKIRSDTLLLRLLLAERLLNLSIAEGHQAVLAARYAATRLRGETVHQQEEAQFALHVQHDASRALILAQENWKVQREPRDARIFLEAALAHQAPHAAEPVLHWLDANRLEDRYLMDLARQARRGYP